MLLLCLMALPWVQQQLGNQRAIIEFSTPGPASDIGQKSTIPMTRPIVWHRDLRKDNGTNQQAIHDLRDNITACLDAPPRVFSSDEIVYRISLIQNKFATGGSNGGLLDRLGDDASPELLDLMKIDTQRESITYGWPFAWRTELNATSIEYDEGNPDGIRADQAIPEPTITTSQRSRVMWDWPGVAATAASVWWIAWFTHTVLHSRGMPARKRAGLIVTLACAYLTLTLILGTRGNRNDLSIGTAVSMEEIQAPTKGTTYTAAELREIITEDSAFESFVGELNERYAQVDRPNALIGLIAEDDISTRTYTMQACYWRHPLISYLSYIQFRETADGKSVPAPRNRTADPRRVLLNTNGLVIRAEPASEPGSLHVVAIHFAEILLWMTGAWILLHALRWCVRPFYRRIQRRRVKRGLCVWCKYPVPGNP